MKSFKSIDEWGHIRHKNIRGALHREDGPAIIYSNGDVNYYLNGKWYSVDDYKVQVIKLKLKRIKDL